jgi:hypothetical protein
LGLKRSRRLSLTTSPTSVSLPADTRGLKPIDMEVCYWALLFMPLVILHYLLNVFVQLANKRGFKQKKSVSRLSTKCGIFDVSQSYRPPQHANLFDSSSEVFCASVLLKYFV